MKPLARICLVGFGTTGDIHPLLALGQALRAHGHPVTVLANPAHEPLVAAARFDLVPVGTAQEQHDTLAHPKMWHPLDGLGVMWRYLLRPGLEPTYAALARLAAQERCVAVANPLAMGARVAQEALGLPLISIYTAAIMLRSTRHPLTMVDRRVPRWCPPVLRAAGWRLLDRVKLEPLVRPALDALRNRLGLPPIQASVFGEWMHSPQAGLALFPDWFAPAPADWPRQVQQAGFPLYDDSATQPAPADIVDFVTTGAPPLVFMPGTGQRETRDFFGAAVQACGQLQRRGVLLGAVPDDVKRSLPPSVRAAGYVPFDWLLPRASGLVHHGGIGTCAQALRAAVPQLVVPSGYDQFDNAMRLERLGVARVLRGGPRSLDRLGVHLKRLVSAEAVRDACTLRASMTTPDAARSAIVTLAARLAP